MNLFFFYSYLQADEEKIEKELILTYEIYEIYYCFLFPDPFLCEKCLKKDMQVARKIIFYENGNIYRENLCIPYKKKYLY